MHCTWTSSIYLLEKWFIEWDRKKNSFVFYYIFVVLACVARFTIESIWCFMFAYRWFVCRIHQCISTGCLFTLKNPLNWRKSTEILSLIELHTKKNQSRQFEKLHQIEHRLSNYFSHRSQKKKETKQFILWIFFSARHWHYTF